MKTGITLSCIAIMFLSLSGCDDSPTGSGGGGDNTPANELVGTWTGDEAGGSSGWTFTFTADGIAISSPGGGEWYNGTYSTDADADPKQLDIVITECFMPEYEDETALAIYEIGASPPAVGETLAIAVNEPGVLSRPSGFSGSGTRVYQLVMQ